MPSWKGISVIITIILGDKFLKILLVKHKWLHAVWASEGSLGSGWSKPAFALFLILLENWAKCWVIKAISLHTLDQWLDVEGELKLAFDSFDERSFAYNSWFVGVSPQSHKRIHYNNYHHLRYSFSSVTSPCPLSSRSFFRAAAWFRTTLISSTRIYLFAISLLISSFFSWLTCIPMPAIRTQILFRMFIIS